MPSTYYALSKCICWVRETYLCANSNNSRYHSLSTHYVSRHLASSTCIISWDSRKLEKGHKSIPNLHATKLGPEGVTQGSSANKQTNKIRSQVFGFTLVNPNAVFPFQLSYTSFCVFVSGGTSLMFIREKSLNTKKNCPSKFKEIQVS